VPGLEDEAAAQALTALRANLAALGLNETMNYSFVSPQSLADAPADDPETVVELPNPVSEDQSLLRPSLLPQIASVIGANVARQTADLRLFEIGRVFRRSEDGGIEEETRVCVGLAGKAGRLGPDVRRPVEPEEAFLWIKGIVEALAAAQRVDNLRFLPGEHPCLEKGMALAVLFGDEPCGMLGLLKAEIRRQWRIMEPAAVAELTAAPFLGAASRPPAFRPVPQYPSVVRDVALIVDDGLPHDTVVRAIRDCAPAELTRIALFDTFRGKGIASGRKSLAYSLTYRSMERTLTDEDANRYHDAIKDGLRRTLNAEIREG
jgi:phenylalanyl-tRNA synthetase beta chain